MDASSEQISKQQKESWNKFSPGWRKWDEFTMKFLEPMGTEIIELVKPKNGETILDIASGTGEPGLSIAKLVGDGKVVMTDLAEGMLDVAKEHAEKYQIKNIETLVCDVSALPFDDSSFDAVSCRHAFMYFPDMQLAANEMYRVLKAGGRVATSVWSGPANNIWVTAMMSVLKQHLEVPQPAAGAPSIFRCAEPGFIADLFKKAGFKNVIEKQVGGKLHFENAEQYWDFHGEVSAPVVGALGKTDEATKDTIKSEVFSLLNNKYPDGNIEMDFGTLVIYGEK